MTNGAIALIKGIFLSNNAIISRPISIFKNISVSSTFSQNVSNFSYSIEKSISVIEITENFSTLNIESGQVISSLNFNSPFPYGTPLSVTSSYQYPIITSLNSVDIGPSNSVMHYVIDPKLYPLNNETDRISKMVVNLYSSGNLSPGKNVSITIYISLTQNSPETSLSKIANSIPVNYTISVSDNGIELGNVSNGTYLLKMEDYNRLIVTSGERGSSLSSLNTLIMINNYHSQVGLLYYNLNFIMNLVKFFVVYTILLMSIAVTLSLLRFRKR